MFGKHYWTGNGQSYFRRSPAQEKQRFQPGRGGRRKMSEILLLEVFHHPQIAFHCVISDRQVTAVGRFGRKKARGMLPQYICITGKIYIEKSSRSETSAKTSANKESFTVRSPVDCM